VLLHLRRVTHGPVRILLAIGFCLGMATAGAAELTALRVNVFPTAKILPWLAGSAKGLFAKHGIKVDLLFTENSTTQREGLAAGAFEIAQSALDNAVAMVDVAGKDVVIVQGGDSGMNEFYVQSYINSFVDIRGHTLVVDAPDTAFALQAKKILLQHGLREGTDYGVKAIGRGVQRLQAMAENKEYAAAIMNPPFSVLAAKMGMKSLGRTVDMLGPYQASGAFVMRPWAHANGSQLESYLAGYIESLRWVLDPAHHAECVAMLVAVPVLKLSQDEAERTYRLLVEPNFGYTPDAKFDLEGFRNTLALRAEIEGKPGSKPPAPEKYLDLSYYQRALAILGR
jgi:ABC-type nitrate/sulfonate/bicarbonate transport system substrate-binding protein